MLADLIDFLRERWWKRGYRRFYASAIHRANPFAMNAGDGGLFGDLVAELTPLVGGGTDRRVLDLGAGNGRLGRALFEGAGFLILADFRAEAIEVEEHGRPVAANMRALPFRPSSFDLIFSYSTLPQFGSERRTLEAFDEWAALLREGGTLYIGDIPERRRIPRILATAVRNRRGPRYWFAVLMQSFYSKRRLVRHLEGIGFTVEVIRQQSNRRFSDSRFDLRGVKLPSGVSR